MDALNTLQKYWGYDSFRPLQEDIVCSAIEGRDTLALLPTGGGKSVCYQIPGLIRDGITIVITPLIALMMDQAHQLKERGIKSIVVHGGMSREEIDIALDNAAYGDFKFLFVSPERLQTQIFQDRLAKYNVGLIAVDESHCISQWGYDFRPSYLEIGKLREKLPSTPVIALTATATPQVVKDIIEKLSLSEVNAFTGSYFRDNLALQTINTTNKLDHLPKLLKQNESAIVYTRSRRMTVDIAEYLNQNGFNAAFYHAGLPHEKRQEIQDRWINGEIPIIASTNAFGMGIDKPDVRQVIHVASPESLEAYIQEAGRAGRDGKPSSATLLYDDSEATSLFRSVHESYPDRPVIQKVYLALCNHFRVPMHAGEGEMFRLRALEFCKKYNIKPVAFYGSLRLLENNGYISVSESIRRRSRVQVILTGEALNNFQANEGDLSELLKHILRTKTGAFDRPVSINEYEIAKAMKRSRQVVVDTLNKLHDREVVSYEESSRLPIVRFEMDRINEDHIRLSPETYSDRKEIALRRAKFMVRYFETKNCRNQVMLAYFGEESDPCGICDNCAGGRSKGITPDVQRAFYFLTATTNAVTFDDIQELLGDEHKSSIVDWLRNSSDEGTIRVDEAGIIHSMK